MGSTWAVWLVRLAGIYLGVGALFAALFICFGAARIDPGAKGAPLAFRLLLLPGSAALWPLLARRWLSARRRSVENGYRPNGDARRVLSLRTWHRRIVIVLAVLLPLLLALVLVSRSSVPMMETLPAALAEDRP